RPDVRHTFRRGARARIIDFPARESGSDERPVRWVEVRYRGIPGNGRAKIQIYGMADEAPSYNSHAEWDPDGWSMLGEREVRGHGREVRDRIQVGRGEGRFSRLTIVVLDADLEIIGMSVAFGRGEPWRPEIKHEFREGQRARVLEFPESTYTGDDERSIRWIDFTYRNLPGEGHARVQVWAR